MRLEPKQPAAPAPPRRLRPAFSLTEMLVSLAVIVVAMAVVTSVFTVTTRTARSTVAMTEVQEAARNFLLQFERDLNAVDPAQSILVISGWTQAAALTPEQLDAGQHYRVLVGDPADENLSAARFDTPPPDGYSDPRSDILMFFTNRPALSKAPWPDRSTAADGFQQALFDGARVSPLLVVYGHAALARSAEGKWSGVTNVRHVATSDAVNELSPIPASQWHLARRATIIEQTAVHPLERTIANISLYRSDALDRTKRGQPGSRYAGDSLPLDIRKLLRVFGNASPFALNNPYGLSGGPGVPQPMPSPVTRLIEGLLYGDDAAAEDRHVATVIENPPPALQNNLAVQMLPGCAWFQVEFLLPEDPRNALDHPDAFQRDDMTRWVEVEPGQTYVFVPDTDENRALIQQKQASAGSRLTSFAPVNGNAADASPQNRHIRMWPYAIRVTVRVFDPLDRLEAPVVRSFVHRFD